MTILLTAQKADPVAHPTIEFVRRGQVVRLSNVPPSRTLLDVLREDLHCTGSKEGCGEGDCGACTVVLGQADPDCQGALRFRAVNSCIRLAHSINGMALWTVEDIATPNAALHPAQQAMVQAHASQCGFCTPGFVMSLYAMYQNYTAKGIPITRTLAQQALSGNLCRCTGYRPILDAAQAMAAQPDATLDQASLLLKIEHISTTQLAVGADFSYQSPLTLAALLQARAERPDAQLVAGCTDVGLWINKQHRQFDRVLDITRVSELRRITHEAHYTRIGAAVTLTDAFEALVQDRPQLHAFAVRFAGLPVRNSGTLGGNVANGSPIGDSMPLLIALGARVVLMSQQGQRELPLEQLYTGYRRHVMAADEVLAWINVPRPVKAHTRADSTSQTDQTDQTDQTELQTKADRRAPKTAALAGLNQTSALLNARASQTAVARCTGSEPDQPDQLGQELPEFVRVYKISKRYDDDISTICLAINLRVAVGTVTHASIGVGGVAAMAVRALKTEAALLGQAWTLSTVQHAMATLRGEFSPISDMRASRAYRVHVLGSLLQRYWLESQGMQHINLQNYQPGQAT